VVWKSTKFDFCRIRPDVDRLRPGFYGPWVCRLAAPWGFRDDGADGRKVKPKPPCDIERAAAVAFGLNRGLSLGAHGHGGHDFLTTFAAADRYQGYNGVGRLIAFLAGRVSITSVYSFRAFTVPLFFFFRVSRGVLHFCLMTP